MSNELWLYDVLFSFRSLFISRLCLVFRFIKTMTSLSIRLYVRLSKPAHGIFGLLFCIITVATIIVGVGLGLLYVYIAHNRSRN